ncbi:rhodanese-like domain-containing protein [Mycolicibacterium fortuitum]
MAILLSRIFKWIPFGNVDEISPETVNRLVMSNPSEIQLLDVRTRREWRSGHIPGAVNIPITELSSRTEYLEFHKSRLTVPICLSGHRSVPAVRLLKELGYENVRQLSGGMRAWNDKFASNLVREGSLTD